MPSLTERIKNGWNAFVNNKDPSLTYREIGVSSSFRPDRTRLTRGNDRSIIASIYNRIAMDVASLDFKHVRTDENGQYLEDMDSSLNDILSFSANIDQTSRQFIQDTVLSLFDEGCIALVPVDTSINPDRGSYDILSIRTGQIVEWFPEHARVRLYNDRKGIKEEKIFSKENIAIIENPFYSVMNERNSILSRLTRKLNLLDTIDEKTGSGKLDLIIQLPYVIKTEARKLQAEKRRSDIEDQLANSKYGIAYTDGTERVTQLNRAVENNLMSQVEYYTKLLYDQLSITDTILNGTAKEEEMINYYNRTIEPIAASITDEFKRKFLTKTARTQHQTVMFIRDPFKLAPVSQIADIADKFTRNEILSSNEVRSIVGFRPRPEASADELRNKNISASSKEIAEEPKADDLTEEELNNNLDELDSFDKDLDDLERDLEQ